MYILYFLLLSLFSLEKLSNKRFEKKKTLFVHSIENTSGYLNKENKIYYFSILLELKNFIRNISES